jgi:hypothetical protein
MKAGCFVVWHYAYRCATMPTGVTPPERMPTIKPRVNVTLEPAAHAALQKLSAITGDSMSKIIADLVSPCVPALGRMAVALERARDAPAEVRAGLLAAVESAERDFLPVIEAGRAAGEAGLATIEAASRARAPSASRAISAGGGRRRAKAGA